MWRKIDRRMFRNKLGLTYTKGQRLLTYISFIGAIVATSFLLKHSIAGEDIVVMVPSVVITLLCLFYMWVIEFAAMRKRIKDMMADKEREEQNV